VRGLRYVVQSVAFSGGAGGRDYDDFQAPPFEDDNDLPF
jgi:hypothetical protein